ncbi:histidine phosphatase family protein [Jeotgalibaca caeni]|uniref:histidine phosphatase family protein n=1 Tax=Jeotgalibaca caeni TaxID=3028623 RepID=UPI00237DFE1B|nr:histidine phosphatase family protein [Jeotgalibaca caeni]MDE1548610.1 histidine phosphatase family protein [Jeotgalibaca caeni]
MQRLYFVRHGQTELNLGKRVQGAIDSPLLDQSRVEAKKTGTFLAETNIQHIISSPQLRAWETAQHIQDHLGREVILEVDDRLKEMGYGEWEGLFIPELAQTHPELFHHLRQEPHLYDPASFGGESYQDLIQRGSECIIEHAEAHPEMDLLFVGHSIHFMSTLLTLTGHPLKDIRSYPPLGNTSVTCLQRDGNTFTIDFWNHVDHLK